MLKANLAAVAFLSVLVSLSLPQTLLSQDKETPIRFAVIGDFGHAGKSEKAVADMVHSWKVDFIVTTGDNNYSDGAEATIDQNIGQYYHDFIAPYTGSYGPGAKENLFFPTLGNHDWVTPDAQPYLDYFALPNNERYYDFVKGPIHFFVLDSDFSEPDGILSISEQADWLRREMSESKDPWNVVTMHVSPYSSGVHGSFFLIQWPFAAWGADAVLTGHDHDYERLSVDGIPYIVNGLGGVSIYKFQTAIDQSQFRYNENYGAMLVTADSQHMTFEFYSIDKGGTLIDTYTVGK